MFYIHYSSCISPQHSFGNIHIDQLVEYEGNKMMAREPSHEGIPPGLLRRMGKAVRLGIGAALPILQQIPQPDGIIIGTANGGMEDCVKFLNQIIEFDEGLLTPGNFVQSTPNAIAAQISLMKANKSYNITHVHRGLAFENALIDVLMLTREHPGLQYLFGGVDEISAYNFNIDYLDGWYKKETPGNKVLYASITPASIAGEGAAMFAGSSARGNSSVVLKDVEIIHSTDKSIIAERFKWFIQQQEIKDEEGLLFLTGENGDSRMLPYYLACEATLKNATVGRYKHMCGEYPTSAAIAVWLAHYFLSGNSVPEHMIKKQSPGSAVPEKIIIYNAYKGRQHGFILLERA